MKVQSITKALIDLSSHTWLLNKSTIHSHHAVREYSQFNRETGWTCSSSPSPSSSFSSLKATFQSSSYVYLIVSEGFYIFPNHSINQRLYSYTSCSFAFTHTHTVAKSGFDWVEHRWEAKWRHAAVTGVWVCVLIAQWNSRDNRGKQGQQEEAGTINREVNLSEKQLLREKEKHRKRWYSQTPL